MLHGHFPTSSRRALFLAACLLPAWAVAVALTGGISWHIGGWNVTSRDPIRPLLAGGVAALVYWWRLSRRHFGKDQEWLARWARQLYAPGVLALGAAVLAAGIAYGTFVASGSDAYGYVSQADLWLAGTLRVSQPLAREVPWPLADWTLAPLGYRPATVPGAIVPAYPSGLPLLMAGFKAVFGPRGPFFVVPVFGALAVWLTYLLGRDATGQASAGGLAALLMATSPAFLFQVMWPMSDVPATAWWALAFWLAFRPGNRRPLLAGLAAGAAVLTRPNLAPVALVIPVAWLWPVWRAGIRRDDWQAIGRLLVGLAPGALGAGAINAHLYGSVWSSGYGDPGSLYSTVNLLTNARRYGAWLLETQTPLVALGLVAIAVPAVLGQRDAGQRSRWVAYVGAIAVVVLSYLLYAPFDDWWYLRFLLPAFPMMFVLVAASIVWLWQKVPLTVGVPLAFILAIPLGAYEVKLAADRQAFDLRPFEQRCLVAARYVAGATPPNALVLSMQHAGSLRYYADRLTVRYDLLSPEWLDRGLAAVRASGYRPYLVLDDWEEAAFRERFSRFSAVGRLERKPIAEFPGLVRVRVFDLDDEAAPEMLPGPTGLR